MMKFLSFFEHPNAKANSRTKLIEAIEVVKRRNNDGSILFMITIEGNMDVIETNDTLNRTLCINLFIGNAIMRFNIYSLKRKHMNAMQIDTTMVHSGVIPNFNKIYDRGKLSI